MSVEVEGNRREWSEHRGLATRSSAALGFRGQGEVASRGAQPARLRS
jgi:hypothetical protein